MSSFLALALLVAGGPVAAPSPAPAEAPAKTNLLIVAGSKDQTAAEGMLAEARGLGTGKLFDSLGWKVLKSDATKGLNPGFVIVAAAACRDRKEADAVLEILRSDFGDAYAREVEENPDLPHCPHPLEAGSKPPRGFAAAGEGAVVPKAKTLKWKVLRLKKKSPVFADMTVEGTMLKAVSGGTTLAQSLDEPEFKPEAFTESYEFFGFLRAFGRDLPAVSAKRSWDGGDLCRVDVYTLRNGAISSMFQLASCHFELPKIQVKGTLNAFEVMAPHLDCPDEGEPCVLRKVRWDAEKKEYAAEVVRGEE